MVFLLSLSYQINAIRKFLVFFIAFVLKVSIVHAQAGFIKKLPIRGVPAKMIATSDGGYACLAATDFVNQQFNKISLIKCDANGDTTWTRKYALNDSSIYYPKDIIEIPNFGFVIVSVYSIYPLIDLGNGVVFFTDHNGYEVWNKIFFDTASASVINHYTKLLRLPSTTFTVLGGVYPSIFLNTLDFAGNLISINLTDTFSYAYSNLNLDTASNPVFSRVMPANLYNRQNVFISDAFYNHLIDQNYTGVKGQFADVNKLDNALAYLALNGDTIIKLDTNLDSLWAHTVTNYYAPGFTTQLPTDFKATADGGYVMCGNISNSLAHLVFLLKTDSLANTAFRQIYFGAVVDNVVSVEQASDGGFVMLQSGNPDSTNVPQMWLVKTDSTGLVTGINKVADITQSLDFKLSPNPTTNFSMVRFSKAVSGTVQVFNLSGNLVKCIDVKSKVYAGISLNGLANGMYMVRFISDQSQLPVTQKLIVNN